MKKSIFFLITLILFLFGAVACSETLVVYFSCTGSTKTVASVAADIAGADLYEILPSVPYTEDDLKYYTDCRADREQADDSARPAIANMPTGLDAYDTILIGYPIWHGQAPKIMYTFLENANLSGKTIIPFCTSHSSGVGSSATNLKKVDKGSNTWKDGKRFSKTASDTEITDWLLGMGCVRIGVNVGDKTRTAKLENNTSAKAFYELLDVSIPMVDYGNFEKVGPLGSSIERNDTKITTVPGDIILYQGDKVTVYYAENTYTFTKLGHIEGATSKNMKSFLGDGDPTVSFLKLKGNELPSRINCTSHTLEKREAVEPTCAAAGSESYWECLVCHKLYSDSNATEEIEGPVIIPATAHQEVTDEAVPPTPIAEGLTEGRHCSVCGAVLVPQETVPIIKGKYVAPDGTTYNVNRKTAAYVKPPVSSTSVSIPDSIRIEDVTVKITSIAGKAFYKNKKLKTVTIGKNIKTIGKNAFSGCAKLAKITVKTVKLTKKTLGKDCFKGISKKAVFKVPKKQKKLYAKIFVKVGNAPKTAKFKNAQ